VGAVGPVLPPVSAIDPSSSDLGSAFRGSRALITGGLGLIGSGLARRLIELGAQVTILDALVPDSSANLFNVAAIREHVRLEMVDLCSTPSLETLLADYDYLFNLAGQSSHTASMTDPITDMDINYRAQLTMLDACRRVNSRAVIVFASTRQIYGRAAYMPVDESHPLRPVDINGINKMAGEALHLLYHDVFGMRTSALRLTNTYGPRMRIKDARQTFVGIWVRKAIEGLPFEVWGGAQRRDFTYVDDAVEAFLLAASCPRAQGHAFNLGGDRAISLLELAELLLSANRGGEFELKSFPPDRRQIDIGDYYADDARFRQLTGWQTKVSLEQGLDRTLAYFRRHWDHYV
jgi:UDP-glucose 4-epimerase